MKNVKVAFQILSEGEKAPNSRHMVFDIKMEDFRQETCLMVGGHMTQTLNAIT